MKASATFISMLFACIFFETGCGSSYHVQGKSVQKDVQQRYSDTIAYLSDVQKRIARFDIPVNFTTGTTYDAFELKATTNNYANGISEDVRLQFYAQSEFADLGRSHAQAQTLPNGGCALDRMWLFTCSSFPVPGVSDSRSYKFIKNTSATGTDGWIHKPMTIVVLVDTEALERHRESNENVWLINTNENLAWSWTRYCYADDEDVVREKEDGTDSVLWRPITPTCWYKDMPKWAADQIGDYWPRSKLQNQMLLQ